MSKDNGGEQGRDPSNMDGEAAAQAPRPPLPDWWESGTTGTDLSTRQYRPPTPARSDPYSTGCQPPSVGSPIARASTSSVSFKPVTLILLISAVLLIVGSVTPWLSATVFGHTANVDGTSGVIAHSIGTNGWITFIAGILLLLLDAVSVFSADSIRNATPLVAAVALGFATYDLVRILQKISKVHSSVVSFGAVHLSVSENVGYGLILVVIGAVGAMAASYVKMSKV
jgi:hypothetical protein